MSTDALTTYEALFKQAQADLHLAGLYEFEKDATMRQLLGLIGERLSGGLRGVAELPGAVRAGIAGDAKPTPGLADAFAALKRDAPEFRARAAGGGAPDAPRAKPKDGPPAAAGPKQVDPTTGPEPKVDQTPAPEAKKPASPPQDADGDGIPDEVEESGRGWLGSLATLGAVGTGVGGVGGGGYLLGQAKAQEEADRRRNLAFGAGMATGVAAPRVLHGVGTRLQDLGSQMGHMQGYGPAPGAYGGYY